MARFVATFRQIDEPPYASCLNTWRVSDVSHAARVKGSQPPCAGEDPVYMQRVGSALLWKTYPSSSATSSKFHNWKSSLSLQVWSVRSDLPLSLHVALVAQPADPALDDPIDAQRPLLVPLYCSLMYVTGGDEELVGFLQMQS